MSLIAARARTRRVALSWDLPPTTLAYLVDTDGPTLFRVLTGVEPYPPRELLQRMERLNPVLQDLPDEMEVGSHGSQRRLRALAIMGWPTNGCLQVCGGQHITARVHCRVVRLYDLLAMIPGPSSTVRAEAVAQGWAGPLDWDEESIDDLTASPSLPVKDPALIDQTAVTRALLGWSVDLTDAEVGELTRRGSRHSLRELNQITGIGRERLAAHVVEVGA